MKRLFALFFIIFIFSIPAEAVEYGIDEFPLSAITDAIPDEVKRSLPEGDIFSETGFSEGFSFEYFASFLKTVIMNTLSPSVKTLTATLGLVLAAAALSLLKGMAKSDSLAAVFEFTACLCILLSIYKTALALVVRVGDFLSALTTLISAMVPTMIAVSSAGGNGGASVANANALMIGVALVEAISAAGLFPILKLCFGMAVCSGMGSSLRLDGISKLVRGVFTFIIGFLAAAISAIMTFQTSIAARADSLSIRAVKFAASSAIPIAGGIASDAVAAVAGSISLIKGAVGWTGVIIVSAMTLPLILEILLTRLGISLSAVAADIIGLEREKRMLDEMCGLFGFLVAICVICALMFIYALALFAGSATALGG